MRSRRLDFNRFSTQQPLHQRGIRSRAPFGLRRGPYRAFWRPAGFLVWPIRQSVPSPVTPSRCPSHPCKSPSECRRGRSRWRALTRPLRDLPLPVERDYGRRDACPTLPIDFTHDDVEGADDGGDVGDEAAAAQFVSDGEVAEGARTRAGAPGYGAAVA